MALLDRKILKELNKKHTQALERGYTITKKDVLYEALKKYKIKKGVF